MKEALAKIIKLNIGIVLLSLSLQGCHKEQIVLESPTITIESAKPLTLTNYEIVVKIVTGEGQELQKAEVVFDDITVLSSTDIIKEIQLSGEKEQIDTIILETDRMNHDYSAKASLTTDNYTYYSESKIIRSNKNRFIIDVYPDDLYSDIRNNIAKFINRGDQFSIIVYYTDIYKPKSIEVKLNKTISLDHYLNFESYWFGNYIETMGAATIPENLDPGIYEVYVYIDGIEFKANGNIKVLKGAWLKIETDFSISGMIGEYSWFVKSNNIYLFGGKGVNGASNNCPIWKYNIPNNTWEQRNNFPYAWDLYKEILSNQIQFNNEAYVLCRNDSVELWNYKEETDEWNFVTIYPGKANRFLTSFTYNNKLYLGGGLRYYNQLGSTIYYDYWEFDFPTKKWQQIKDIPVKFYGKGGISCVTQNKDLFIFSYANELWQYHPTDDSWIQKKKFPGHIRTISNFIEGNNKLYIIAGLYSDDGYAGLRDCWEYTIESDSWEMVALMPEFYANGIAFTYNNSIYAGLGWVVSGYYSSNEQNFYQLTF